MLKNIISALFMLVYTMGWAQHSTGSVKEPVVGDVKPQSEVFGLDFPIWDNLRQGQRDSARAMTWHDYLSVDTLFAWNSIEGGMARFTPFSGKDSILVVRLDNGHDAIYRKKCKNRNRRVEQTPKGATENPPAVSYVQNNFHDNRSYQWNVKLERPALQPLPPVQCCDEEEFGESEFGAYFSVRHLSGNALLEQGTQGLFGLQLVNRKLGKGPGGKIFGRPLGWKSMVEIYVAKGNTFEAPCDTCGVWVPEPENEIQFGIGLGTGPIILDWRPFHDVSWLSFRFAILLRYETVVKKDESADLKGLFIEPEGEILFGKPTGIHVKVEIAERFHPFPTKPANWDPVAATALTGTVVVPFGDAEKIEERKLKKAEAAAKKATADTIAQRERIRAQFITDSLQFVTDNLLVDSLLEHGDTIAIDSAMKVSDPVPQENKFWELKGKREARKITELNTAKSDVYYYVQRFNFLYKAVDEDDDSLRLALAQTYRKLELAQKNYETVKAKHAGKEKKGKTPANSQ